MALFGQVVFNPPPTALLAVLQGLYPILGFVSSAKGSCALRS